MDGRRPLWNSNPASNMEGDNILKSILCSSNKKRQRGTAYSEQLLSSSAAVWALHISWRCFQLFGVQQGVGAWTYFHTGNEMSLHHSTLSSNRNVCLEVFANRELLNFHFFMFLNAPQWVCWSPFQCYFFLEMLNITIYLHWLNVVLRNSASTLCAGVTEEYCINQFCLLEGVSPFCGDSASNLTDLT